MVSAGNALAPGPGNIRKGVFRWREFIIRFGRYGVFHTSGSAGGHDFCSEERTWMPQYEDCIIFLLAKAYQRAHSAFKMKLAPFGITPVQHLILAVLAEEESLSPAEISDRVAMDGATLSGVLERMAEAGLIKKEENTQDRRSIRVSLLPKAKRMREELAEHRKSINEDLTAKFSPEEKLLLKRMLKDLKG